MGLNQRWSYAMIHQIHIFETTIRQASKDAKAASMSPTELAAEMSRSSQKLIEANQNYNYGEQRSDGGLMLAKTIQITNGSYVVL